MKKINKYLLAGVIFAAGILIGKWVSDNRRNPEPTRTQAEETQVWTCSMHPQIRQSQPGKCPLCAMDLVPVKTETPTGTTPTSPLAIRLSEEAAALANIQTLTVERRSPVKTIQLYGTIKLNEKLLRSQVAHVGGRIESLAVHATGEQITPGQTIATIYSPELLNAQQELLEAQKLAANQPNLLNAAREKLRQWKLTDKQIETIEQSGKPIPAFPVTANVGGIVTAKRVEEGDYVDPGAVLFDLADLASVWAVFDAYERDLPSLKIGNRLEYTLSALPGKTFSGTIAFIEPLLDKTTRTAKVRVETPNPHRQLKPEMYAAATVTTTPDRNQSEIIIPQTAVLWTGKRSIVYVRQADNPHPAFQLREIQLGESLGDHYIVLAGLDAGEEIAQSGVFAIDASAQLEGKPSMMNRDESAPRPETATQTDSLLVQGLCGMCKDRIETTAAGVDGVSLAVWNSETKQLRLKLDPARTSRNAIAQALAAVGHDNEKRHAPDSVYNQLPPCCQYRNPHPEGE